MSKAGQQGAGIPVTFEMITEAREALKGIAEYTPMIRGRMPGTILSIKAENLQRTGSFKIRGAYNKLRSLSPEEAARGVIACSAGNHAQGVALSATRLGIRSVICMPASAPILKVEATRSYGGEVVLVDGNYDDSANRAAELAAEYGYTVAHPFNDPCVIAGQGTIGLEILDQMPDVQQVLVPVGGGGLISGVALAIKTLRPDVKVIGVQSVLVPSMFASFGLGEIRTVRDAPTIADGIHVLTPGDITFPMIQEYVDDIVTVSEAEIAAAIVALMEGPKTIAEGAGAAGVAAYLFNKVDPAYRTVAVVSGGNVDITTLERIITKGMQKMGRMAQMTARLEDDTASLVRFLSAIAETGANILKITHERENDKTEVHSCLVTFTLETSGKEHIATIRAVLAEKGFSLVE